jgi:hypothetical protein
MFMSRLLSMIVVLAVVVAAFGYYRGWFRAESVDSHDQHTVTLTVDKNKFEQDKAEAQQNVADLEHK